MTKTTKILVVLGVIFALMVVLLPVEGCLIFQLKNRIYTTEKDIVDFVQENKQVLEKFVAGEIQEEEFYQLTGHKMVERISHDVEQISNSEEETFVFTCESKGASFAPSTEVGFLYNSEDRPNLQGVTSFQETEPGKYFYSFGSDDTMEANRILPGWFYYRIHWH